MQDVEGVPVHSYQRKAAIADGAIADHSAMWLFSLIEIST